MSTFYLPESNYLIEAMLTAKGHSISNSYDKKSTDAILFSGGSDVTPMIYGEYPHPTTNWDIDRDIRDIRSYKRSVRTKRENGLNVPLIGICRGAQLLNVLCGGTLWQNVDKHATDKGHDMLITGQSGTLQVTSTHHQMMKPSYRGQLLAYARLSTMKESGDPGVVEKNNDPGKTGVDPEVVYYPEYNTLCFQPHPEYDHRCDPKDMREYFFELLAKLFKIQ